MDMWLRQSCLFKSFKQFFQRKTIKLGNFKKNPECVVHRPIMNDMWTKFETSPLHTRYVTERTYDNVCGRRDTFRFVEQWRFSINILTRYLFGTPDSKVHGANMGPILGRQEPGGPHVGPMNFVIWDSMIHCHVTPLSYYRRHCGCR